MRLRRSLYCAFATISCSVFTAVAPAQAAGPTITHELDRLVAEGRLPPEDAAAQRALYTDPKATVKQLSGARKAELGGVITDLQGMAARGSFSEPSRLPALFLTLQRNREY